MGWLLSFGLCHKTRGSGRSAWAARNCGPFFTLKQIQLFGFLWRRLRFGGTRVLRRIDQFANRRDPISNSRRLRWRAAQSFLRDRPALLRGFEFVMREDRKCANV